MAYYGFSLWLLSVQSVRNSVSQMHVPVEQLFALKLPSVTQYYAFLLVV